MRPVKIITDSCSDLGKDIREKYDIDYAKMNTVYQSKETPANLDWAEYSVDELYSILRKGDRILTTQVPAAEFEAIFTKYLDMGMDIVYISCSVKQTGSVNTATVVAQQLMQSHPEAKIFAVDSFNACLGEGLVAVKAAMLRDEGMNAQQIADEIIRIRKNVNEFIAVHTLDALKRSGRVKASAAFFGNLMGVKPILIADKNGVQTPIKKVKGRQNSLKEIVAMTKDTIVDPENQVIFVAHADCPEEAENLKTLIKEQIPCKDVYVNVIGPIIGASIGPDAIGVFSFGKEVTFEV